LAGGAAEKLNWILNTHPDIDHTGGNAEMKSIAPASILACGAADWEQCSGPEPLFAQRYDVLRAADGVCLAGEIRKSLYAAAGKRQMIELTLTGGERIALGETWSVEIVRLPGHSHGHIGVWDPNNRALYGADAIHGSGYLGLDGKPKMGPTYFHVDEYLDTIQFIRDLPIATYVGSHWPILRGEEIRQFCDDSRDFVDRAERLLLALIENEPKTLRECCSLLGPQLGEWPREADSALSYAVKGHLVQLESRGRIRGWKSGGEISLQYQCANYTRRR